LLHRQPPSRSRTSSNGYGKSARRLSSTAASIYRPWGYYQDVDAAERYQVKRIVVKPGGKLSLQKHFHRSEHWVVVEGTAEVTIGDDLRTVHENGSIYIPIGCLHRLANPGKIPLEFIEVQVGSYLGEDDIVRLDDTYHRWAPLSALPQSASGRGMVRIPLGLPCGERG
jgi:mannose-1-phosphate guanylyltransferase/mannose-6-phosphate isomerase